MILSSDLLSSPYKLKAFFLGSFLLTEKSISLHLFGESFLFLGLFDSINLSVRDKASASVSFLNVVTKSSSA